MFISLYLILILFSSSLSLHLSGLYPAQSRVCVRNVWTDVKRRWQQAYFIKAGDHRCPGRVGDQRRHLPGTRVNVYTCGAVVVHLGAFKSQLVATIVPYMYIYTHVIYIYIYIYVYILSSCTFLGFSSRRITNSNSPPWSTKMSLKQDQAIDVKWLAGFLSAPNGKPHPSPGFGFSISLSDSLSSSNPLNYHSFILILRSPVSLIQSFSIQPRISQKSAKNG